MARLPKILTRRRAKPAAASEQPKGASGRFHFNGYLDLDEVNNALKGRAGLDVFDSMWRTDPDVRRSLAMLCNPITGATWATQLPKPKDGQPELTDDEQQAADDLAWALGLGEYSAEAIDRISWSEHLAEAVPLTLRSGFTPTEVTWGRRERDGRQLMVPVDLGIRLPRSVWKWHADKGRLVSIEQYVPQNPAGEANGDEAGYITLDASDLLYYRVGAEGDNWEGTSILRAAYKPWLFKDGGERLDAMALEREAIGLPVVYPPQSASVSPDVLADLEDKLALLREGELGYLMMPGPSAEDVGAAGWRFSIEGIGGNGSGARDAQPTLQYHRDAIAAVLMVEFMRLGQGSGSTGALSTAESQDDPFKQAVEAVAGIFEAEARRKLVARFYELNYSDKTLRPARLTMATAEADMVTLQTYAAALATAGLLHPDDPLEDHLREIADLPPADQEARKARQDMEQQSQQAALDQAKAGAVAQPAVGADGHTVTEKHTEKRGADGSKTVTKEKSTAKQVARTLAELDAIEPVQLSERPAWADVVDVDALTAAFDGAGVALQAAVAPAVAAYAAEAARNPSLVIEGPQQPPQALVDAAATELARLRELGRRSVLAERRRVTLAAVPASDAILLADEGHVGPRAVFFARAVVQAIANAIVGRKLNGTSSPSMLQTAGEDAGAAVAKAEGASQGGGAIGDGRVDTATALADEVKGCRYTSLLDRNRCDACAAADDGVLRTLNDPIRLERRPPNPECRSTLGGRNRCRCIEVYEFADEAPSHLDAGDEVFTLAYNAHQPRDPHTGEWIQTPHPSALNLTANLGGSTGAKLGVGKGSGKKYVVKRGGDAGGNAAGHLREEDAADRAYRVLGAPVPKSQLHDVDGAPVKVAEFMEGAKPLAHVTGMEKAEAGVKLRQHFVADALLGNWDVIGLDADNVLVKDGTPYRIDNGGALRYRAMGKGKNNWGSVPTELWTLREGGQGAPWFGGLPWHDVMAQAKDVLSKRDQLLDPQQIPGDEQRAVLAKRLDGLQLIVGMHDAGLPEDQIRQMVSSFDASTGTPPRVALNEDLDDDATFTLAAWNPKDHPRDHDGRFKAKIGGKAMELLEHHAYASPTTRAGQKAIKFKASKQGANGSSHTVAMEPEAIDDLIATVEKLHADKAHVTAGQFAKNAGSYEFGLKSALLELKKAQAASHAHHGTGPVDVDGIHGANVKGSMAALKAIGNGHAHAGAPAAQPATPEAPKAPKPALGMTIDAGGAHAEVTAIGNFGDVTVTQDKGGPDEVSYTYEPEEFAAQFEAGWKVVEAPSATPAAGNHHAAHNHLSTAGLTPNGSGPTAKTVADLPVGSLWANPESPATIFQKTGPATFKIHAHDGELVTGPGAGELPLLNLSMVPSHHGDGGNLLPDGTNADDAIAPDEGDFLGPHPADVNWQANTHPVKDFPAGATFPATSGTPGQVIKVVTPASENDGKPMLQKFDSDGKPVGGVYGGAPDWTPAHFDGPKPAAAAASSAPAIDVDALANELGEWNGNQPIEPVPGYKVAYDNGYHVTAPNGDKMPSPGTSGPDSTAAWIKAHAEANGAPASSAPAPAKPGKPTKGPQAVPDGVKVNQLDLVPGDVLQVAKGHGKLTIVEPYGTGWKVKTAKGKHKYVAGFKQIGYVTKADGSALSTVDPAAAPAAPKTHAELVADAKAGLGPLNKPAGELPEGSVIQTPQGAVVVVKDHGQTAHADTHVPVVSIDTGKKAPSVPKTAVIATGALPHFPAGKAAAEALTKVPSASTPTSSSTPAAPKPKVHDGNPPEFAGVPDGTGQVDPIITNLHKSVGAQLDAEEIAAIKWYTGGGFIPINAALREEGTVKGAHHEKAILAAAAIKRAIAKAPAFDQDVIIGRKTDWKPWMDASEGSIITDDGIMSTSTSPSAWSGPVQLRIMAPKGTKGLYVDYGSAAGGSGPLSVNAGSEKEILLPAGMHFKVLKRVENPSGSKYSGAKTVLYVKLLG